MAHLLRHNRGMNAKTPKPPAADLVWLKEFTGASNSEIAEAFGVNGTTIGRWLNPELAREKNTRRVADWRRRNPEKHLARIHRDQAAANARQLQAEIDAGLHD